MLVVKDSMILIHLASVGVLREACIMFTHVIVPCAVHDEVVERGIEEGHSDAFVVQKLEREGFIHVMPVADKPLMHELKKYGLEGGELEAVTLYFQEKADLLASNDDKVRRLRLILGLDLISSPEIVFVMAKNKVIANDRATDCLLALKKIGWFSPSVIDTIVEEVKRLG